MRLPLADLVDAMRRSEAFVELFGIWQTGMVAGDAERQNASEMGAIAPLGLACTGGGKVRAAHRLVRIGADISLKRRAILADVVQPSGDLGGRPPSEHVDERIGAAANRSKMVEQKFPITARATGDRMGKDGLHGERQRPFINIIRRRPVEECLHRRRTQVGASLMPFAHHMAMKPQGNRGTRGRFDSIGGLAFPKARGFPEGMTCPPFSFRL